MAMDPADTVHRTGIQSSGLINRVLDLQAGFDVFDRGSDEGDCPSCEDSCDAVTESREFWFQVFSGGAAEPQVLKGIAVEQILIEHSTVEGQAPEHDTVHEHPSDERRCRALV